MAADARGFHTTGSDEVDVKAARVADVARQEGLAGILLSTQHNFAWLSGGRSNRVDGSREAGVATLLVAADRRRWLIASNIECERIQAEALAGLGFEPRVMPWEEERADPMLPLRIATAVAGAGTFGSDSERPHARVIEGLIARVRAPLLPAETDRYRQLGADASRVMGGIARRVRPGSREEDVARELSAGLIAANMRPIVVLVGADDRIASYRHPVPTPRVWESTLLLVVCAERNGLVVALSRIVSSRRNAELENRTRACAEVFGRVSEATIPGAIASDVFAAARDAYRDAGYPGEERLHHQGGATGYRSREWIAHPAAADVVRAPQAFAWNPSISGTKVEETFLLHDDSRIELLTHDPAWPSIDVDVRGIRLPLPGVLIIDD